MRKGKIKEGKGKRIFVLDDRSKLCERGV